MDAHREQSRHERRGRAARRVVLGCGLIASAALCFVVPWEYTFQRPGMPVATKPAGYAPLYGPPRPERDNEYNGVQIDVGRLLAGLAAVAVATAAGGVALSLVGQRRTAASGPEEAKPPARTIASEAPQVISRPSLGESPTGEAEPKAATLAAWDGQHDYNELRVCVKCGAGATSAPCPGERATPRRSQSLPDSARARREPMPASMRVVFALGVLTTVGVATSLVMLSSLASEMSPPSDETDELLAELVTGHIASALVMLPLLAATLWGALRRRAWGYRAATTTCIVYLVGKGLMWAGGWGPMSLVIGAPVFCFILYLLGGERWRRHYGIETSTDAEGAPWREPAATLTVASGIAALVCIVSAVDATKDDPYLDWREWGASKQPRTEVARSVDELMRHLIDGER